MHSSSCSEAGIYRAIRFRDMPGGGCSMGDSELRMPLRVINSAAPIRICDNGGWTDTWFAGYGRIFNIGIYPYVEVQIEVFHRDALPDRVTVYAENFRERFVAHPDNATWDQHPLLEAAIARMKVPENLALQVTIFSEAPSGASTGTSAGVAVALVGALDRLTY